MSLVKCQCCCPVIGFDAGAMSHITGCCTGMSPLINLAVDVSRIGECTAVFAGSRACGVTAVNFAAGDWPAVRAYIEGGGRLWIQGEYQGCLADSADFNSFLAAMGSSIQWVGSSYDSGCATDGSRDCTPGAANIAQSLSSPFRMALTAEMSGGTSVWLAPSGVSMIQVEQLGDGFLFASGDANPALGPEGGCSYDHCEFFRRLWEYEDADII